MPLAASWFPPHCSPCAASLQPHSSLTALKFSNVLNQILPQCTGSCASSLEGSISPLLDGHLLIIQVAAQMPLC